MVGIRENGCRIKHKEAKKLCLMLKIY